MGKAVPAEVEAKLLVPRVADLRAIARLSEIGTYRLRTERSQRLHTLYLDTADLALARQGVALRLRRAGKRWELTAKWRGSVSGAIHRRPELTVPLRRAPEFPYVLDAPELHEPLASLIAGRPLRVVLVTDILRRRRSLLPAEGGDDAAPLAELALDTVHLHGVEAGPEDRYHELELEQQAGRVDDLEQVVAALRQRYPLHVSDDTKFARGMLLLHGFRGPASNTEALGSSDSVTAAARTLVSRQLAKIRAHDPGTRRGADPEALHDMRVAVRRLRAVVKALAPGFPEALAATLRRELKWLGGELGAVRDLDVQLERVAGFATAVPPALRPSFEEFQQHLTARRETARTALLAALDAKRYGVLLQRLERFADGRTRVARSGPGGEPAAALAAEQLRRAFAKLCKQGAAVHAEPLPEELHALRIRAKRMRYVLEFFGELAGKPARRAARRLRKLQDLLGDYNDSVVAAAFVQGYVDGPGAAVPASALMTLGAVLGAEIGRGERLRARFAKRWKRFTGKRSVDDVARAIERLTRLAAAQREEGRAPRSGKRPRRAARAVPVESPGVGSESRGAIIEEGSS